MNLSFFQNLVKYQGAFIKLNLNWITLIKTRVQRYNGDQKFSEVGGIFSSQRESSKEMGFYNPRSHLDSTVVTYWPMQLKNREDR